MLCQNYRQWALSTLLAFSAPLGALVLDRFYNAPACELCSISRAFFVLIGGCFLALTLQSCLTRTTAFRRFLQGITLLFCSAGILISGRQLYLQYLSPPTEHGCAPNLGYLLDNFGLIVTVQKLWAGGASCQKMDIQFLGVSLAGYAFALFSLLALSALIGQCCKSNSSKI